MTVRRPDGAHEVSEARTLRAVETGRAYARVDLQLPADWIQGPPPTTTITSVAANPLEDVVIRYELASVTRRTLDLAAEYSTDDGATWEPAQVTGQTQRITPASYRGSLVWSTVARFPGRLVLARVRLTATDAQQSGPATVSDEFEIRNAPTPIGAVATLPHDAAASFVTFSPDSSILATGSDDGAIRLWSAQSQVLFATMAAHERVLSLAFSPDARLIASGGPDPTAKLWDAQTHRQIAALDGHSGWVASVAFSPGASILATGSHDGTVKLWDLASHAVITTLPNDNAVWCVAFSPDGRLLAVGGDSGAIRLWNVSNPGSPASIANLRGHSGAARSVAFSSDGLVIVSGGWDRTVRTWERPPGRAFAPSVVHRGHEFPVWSVAVSPFGELVASGSADATVRAWFPAAPGQLAELIGHAGTVRSVAFSPDGELLVSAGDDGAVTLWPSPVLTLNLPPTISVSTSSLTVAEGASATLTVSAVDPDGDPLVFAAESLPANATLDPVTGRFRIEPDYTQSGRLTVEFSVSDGKRGVDTVSVDLRVTAEDLFRVRLGPRLVVGGESLTVGLAANHAVPDNVSVTAPDLPANASFDAAKRELTFTPDLTQAGFYDVTFRVTQRGRLAEEHDVTLRVDHSAAFGLEPSEPQTVGEGQTLVAQATRTANAGDDTTLAASPLPPNATFDDSTGRFTFTPDYTQAGAYTITFEAWQGDESVQKERLRVTVDDASPFTLNPSEPQLLSGGAVRVIAVELAAAAQGAVTVSADGLPPNASFSAAANEITLSPAFGQTGDHTITVRASQNGEVVQTEEIHVAISDSELFTLDPPVSPQMTEGESTTVRVVLAADAPDTLTVAVRDLPPNATFNAATNRLTFQPDYTQAGAYTITVEVSQNGSPVQAADVRITVSDAEVFAINPSGGLILAEGETASASVAGTPAALRAVTFSATDLPPNATFDASARRLTFSPDYTQAGDYAITVEARQSGQVVQTDEILVAVTDVRVLSLAPSQDVEIAEGQTAVIQVNRGVDAPGLTIVPRDLPSNASYDPSTDLLTFTPDFRQAGEHALTVVAMQDAREVGSETVRVLVANVASFTLDPDGAQSVAEGAEAVVQVLKADGVADDVTFSVTGLPRNASYDDDAGVLRFAPDFAQQGAYTVTVDALQGGLIVDSESLTFTVANVDVLSTTPSGSHRVDEGASLTIRANISAAAAGAVTLSATGLPTNASFNPTTRSFTFNPTFAQSGSYSPTIRATQSGRTVEEETLRITVVDINVPPTVTVTAPTGAATGDARIGYTIVDFDGDRVTLTVEYREGSSGTWTAASLDRSVANTATYTGSTNWRTRDDFPSTGGAEVQVRVTPSDSSSGTPATTSAFTVVNLLGDYDEDMDVDFDDVALFTQAWRENDTDRDIGPTTGAPPELTPDYDDVIDFEDLATFLVMWNWSAENAPLAAPTVVSAPDGSSPLVYEAMADRSDWRRQRVSFALDEPTDLLAARITLRYDPRQLRVHVAEPTDERAGRVLLDRSDEASGVLDIQTAWLTEGALLDTLASIQVENLRDFDAELRLTFDIRDRLNTSRRGHDVFRMRFDPPPASTALLQNYPNPFNPETWIPFELSEDAEVTVSIYSVEGALIRTLYLGERALGRYRDRDRAAYWDGANERGEPAASGMYIYELRAATHRETRRMVIRK
ncbi:hypothetical protein HOI71_05405 [Candidatus Poribacteria bacterium]|nr:hypothetical protein [Candidatus Poribacteria bacterium]